MGKKSKAERQTAHAIFEQKRAVRDGKSGNGEALSSTDTRIAAEFLLSSDPGEAADRAMMSAKVISKIANGHFSATANQSKQIVTAAREMGWTRSGPA